MRRLRSRPQERVCEPAEPEVFGAGVPLYSGFNQEGGAKSGEFPCDVMGGARHVVAEVPVERRQNDNTVKKTSGLRSCFGQG